ncbi:hypothetical protein [Leisingera sp. JC11]|uniref:hypothetical protein n=1 Tax=Leisingera sp. JC11 TaxID=3042469 RepID=UPI0034567161
MNIVYHEQQNGALPRGKLTDAQYALASGFVANWNRTRETIIEMAKLAKQIEDLPFREKRPIKAHLETHAKISSSVLSRLVKIGKNSVLMNENNLPFLPASYNTLYALADKDEKLDDNGATLTSAIHGGKITPKLLRKDVDGIFQQEPKSQAEIDAEKQAKNIAAGPSIKVTIKGNFTNVPADKLQALNDLCKDLAECGVVVGLNEVNRVG